MIGSEGAATHVFGGTSDALAICRALEAQGIAYSLSVATEVGEALAAELSGEIIVRRMTADEMQRYLAERGIGRVIDATHPFAEQVSRNVLAACKPLAISCLRYERPEQIDALSDPLLFKVGSVEQACAKARSLGERILLTTGSKQLADYVRLLPGKTLFARVLPTVSVLESCYRLGLGVGNIIAMMGPFSADMNLATYRFYRPDAVITKESGDAGGYRQKVEPCLALGIPCIVIKRPRVDYEREFSDIDELMRYLTACEQ